MLLLRALLVHLIVLVLLNEQPLVYPQQIGHYQCRNYYKSLINVEPGIKYQREFHVVIIPRLMGI